MTAFDAADEAAKIASKADRDLDDAEELVDDYYTQPGIGFVCCQVGARMLTRDAEHVHMDIRVAPAPDTPGIVYWATWEAEQGRPCGRQDALDGSGLRNLHVIVLAITDARAAIDHAETVHTVTNESMKRWLDDLFEHDHEHDHDH